MKRDLRICLNKRGFPTFLYLKKAQLMQCIELESILNKLTDQILILAAGLTFRGHILIIPYWAARQAQSFGFRSSVAKNGLLGEGRHEGLVPRNDVLTNGFI